MKKEISKLETITFTQSPTKAMINFLREHYYSKDNISDGLDMSRHAVIENKINQAVDKCIHNNKVMQVVFSYAIAQSISKSKEILGSDYGDDVLTFCVELERNTTPLCIGSYIAAEWVPSVYHIMYSEYEDGTSQAGCASAYNQEEILSSKKFKFESEMHKRMIGVFLQKVFETASISVDGSVPTQETNDEMMQRVTGIQMKNMFNKNNYN